MKREKAKLQTEWHVQPSDGHDHGDEDLLATVATILIFEAQTIQIHEMMPTEGHHAHDHEIQGEVQFIGSLIMILLSHASCCGCYKEDRVCHAPCSCLQTWFLYHGSILSSTCQQTPLPLS